MTILVLDDEAMVLRLMAGALMRAGYTVIETTRGQEAIDKAAKYDGEIKLLITNHRLPDGMSGRDVAEIILKHRPAMLVLHISGYPEETLRGEGSLTPGSHYIAK